MIRRFPRYTASSRLQAFCFMFQQQITGGNNQRARRTSGGHKYEQTGHQKVPVSGRNIRKEKTRQVFALMQIEFDKT